MSNLTQEQIEFLAPRARSVGPPSPTGGGTAVVPAKAACHSDSVPDAAEAQRVQAESM